MVHIDMNKPDASLLAGVDLWQIMTCTATVSGSGDQMLKLKFQRVSDPKAHLYDNVMLEGRGWGIGRQKCGALLSPDFSGDLDPLDLVGAQLWVETKVEEYQGKKRLAVDIKGLKHGGFQRREDVPKGKELPADTGVSDEDVPF